MERNRRRGDDAASVEHRVITFGDTETNASKEELVGEWGRWLDESFEWTHVSTLTYRNHVSIDSAKHDLLKHVQDLERREEFPIQVFWVAEIGREGGLHFHVVYSVRSLDEVDIRRSWEWRNKRSRERDTEHRTPRGQALVEEYRSTGGFTGYMMKHVGGRVVDYDFAGGPAERSAA